MDLSFLKDKGFAWFVIKFILVFVICYYGTLAGIGLSAPEGYYSPFVDKYLNHISWIRSSLLYGTKIMLSLFGVDTYMASEFNIRKVNGRGIIIVYECVGYGIMSFWIAFVAASGGSLLRKIGWILSGLIFFWLLNITRLALLLVATNKGWGMPLGWDHHTWFNIAAYSVMLVLIYLYNKQKSNVKNIKKRRMLVDLSSYDNSWYKPGSLIKRACWYWINMVFFKTGVFPIYSLKIFLLKVFGARIGTHVLIKPYVNIKYPWFLEIGDNSWIGEQVWIDNLAMITIGRNVCVSQGALLLSGNHDFTKSSFDLMISPIVLEDGVWVGAKAIVCGGAICRHQSVITAGSLIAGEADANGLYKGVPAVKVRDRVIS